MRVFLYSLILKSSAVFFHSTNEEIALQHDEKYLFIMNNKTDENSKIFLTDEKQELSLIEKFQLITKQQSTPNAELWLIREQQISTFARTIHDQFVAYHFPKNIKTNILDIPTLIKFFQQGSMLDIWLVKNFLDGNALASLDQDNFFPDFTYMLDPNLGIIFIFFIAV